MTTIHRFEEIEAWQKARELTRAIYKCSRERRFDRDYGLCDQIRKAAVSIMSNIAEGFGRGGNKELVQFLSTARGSVSEVQSQLYIALDADYINSDQFKKLYAKAQETGHLISGFMRYLNRSPLKGSKFRNPGTINREPKTMNHEQRTTNHEPQTMNHEPQTMNHKP